MVEGEFAESDRVDDHARRVRRVPDFEFEFQIEGHAAKGFAFHADVTPLAVFQPRDVVAGADVDVVLAEVVVELRRDGLRFGDFF